jgi:O-succinylbenzoic acid--CoA ligase
MSAGSHNPWQGYPVPTLRHEAWCGDRLVRAMHPRPAHWPAMWDAAVAQWPQAEALVCGQRRWTYAQLDADVQALCTGLAQLGLGAGDRVLMFMDNRAEFVITLLAAQRLGAITVPVGVREQRPGLAYIARQCGAVALVADASLADRLPDAQEAPALRWRISSTETPGLNLPTLMQAGRSVGTHPAATPNESDTAVILYTSGTTGHPKGAMLSHRNIVHSVLHYQACMRLAAGERSALAVPASHVTGLIAVIASMLAVCGAVVIVHSFKAEAFIALMAAERISHTLMVPAMYQLSLMHPRFASTPLQAWRVGGYGGAPMPVATIEALNAALPQLTLLNAYGATETTSPTTMMPMGETARHADTVGVALPAADIRVMDDDGRELPLVRPASCGSLGPWWCPATGPTPKPPPPRSPQATGIRVIWAAWMLKVMCAYSIARKTCSTAAATRSSASRLKTC